MIVIGDIWRFVFGRISWFRFWKILLCFCYWKGCDLWFKEFMIWVLWRVLWFCYWEVFDFVIEEFYRLFLIYKFRSFMALITIWQRRGFLRFCCWFTKWEVLWICCWFWEVLWFRPWIVNWEVVSWFWLLTCFGICIWKLIKTTLWDFWKVIRNFFWEKLFQRKWKDGFVHKMSYSQYY